MEGGRRRAAGLLSRDQVLPPLTGHKLIRSRRDYDPRDEPAVSAPSITPQPQPVGSYSSFQQVGPVPPAPAPLNPAAELYKYLLSNSERNKLLAILSTSAELLNERRFGSGEGIDAENAVLLALQVRFLIAIEQVSDALRRRLWTQF